MSLPVSDPELAAPVSRNVRRAGAADRALRESETELDFAPYLDILKRRRWLLVLGALLGGVAGFAYSLSRPVRYEAVTTLVTHMPQRPGTAGADRATLRAFLENQSIAGQVLKDLSLDQPPHGLTPQRFLAGAVQVDEPAGTNLFRVRVRLGDPALAAEASRRLAHGAVALNRQVAGGAGGALRDQLEPHLAEATRRLDDATRQFLASQGDAQIELLEADSEAMIGERGDLFRLLLEIESERARVRAAEEELERRQPLLGARRLPAAEEALQRAAAREAELDRERRAERSGASPAGTPGQKPQARSDETGTGSGAAREAGSRAAGEASPGPPPAAPSARPTVRALDRTAVDPATLDLSDPTIDPVHQTLAFQLATSRARLAALERHRAELARRVGGPALKELTTLYEKRVEVSRRENDYKLARRVFDDVLLRYERAGTDLVDGSAFLQVVDEAVPPDDPMPRKRLQTLMLGVLAGFILAGAAAVLLESGTPAGPVRRA